MCVILYLKSGTDKKDPFLKEAITKASKFNKDGMGYAIKRKDNSLYLSKGYFDVETFIECIQSEKVLKSEELLIHLRIGNVGEVNANMCHPFVVSADQEEIIETIEGYINKPILAHNGTMIEHKYVKSKLSDTVHFIRDVLSYDSVQNFLHEDEAVFEEVMNVHLNYSRLAIMHPNEHKTNILGKWFEHKGILFSKDYEKEYKTYDTKKKTYDTNNYYNISNLHYNDELFSDELDDTSFSEFLKGTSSYEKPVKNIEIKLESLVPNYDIREIYMGNTGIKYTKYMGFFLPEVIESKYRLYNISIDNESVNDVGVSCVKRDVINGFEPGNLYNLDETTDNEISIVDIHTSEIAYTSKTSFYEHFIHWPKSNKKSFYDSLYELVVNIPISRNMVKKFRKNYNRSISSGKQQVGFRGKMIDMDIASKFIKLAEEELEFVKNPHKLLY